MLGNDTPNGGSLSRVGANTGSLTATIGTPTATAGGGSVTLNADGSFTYDPPVGQSGGTDSFAYELTNANPTPDTAIVTITIGGGANQIVWFVNNNAGACPAAPCDGRFTHPFTSTGTLQTAQGTANGPAAGEAIFVYESASAYSSTNLTLLGTQKLIGQDATGTFAAAIGFTPDAASTGPLPVLNTGGNAVTLTSAAGNTLTLGSSNTVRGMTFGSTPATSLVGTNFGTLTINDVSINNPAGPVVALDTGAFGASSVIDSITATVGGSADGILLTSVTGSFTVNGGTLAVNSTSSAVQVVGGSVSMTYNGSISQAGAGELVRLDPNGATPHTGTLTFQTGTLQSTGTTSTSLQFDNADGTYNFAGGGASTGGSLSLAGQTGVRILNGSSGTFNLGSGSVALTAGTLQAFRVDSSNPTVTGSGSFTKSTTTGNLIDINAMSGGSVDLSGQLTATTPAGGISVTGSTNSPSITFSGNNKALGTAANTGVTFTGNSARHGAELHQRRPGDYRDNGHGIPRFRPDGRYDYGHGRLQHDLDVDRYAAGHLGRRDWY